HASLRPQVHADSPPTARPSPIGSLSRSWRYHPPSTVDQPCARRTRRFDPHRKPNGCDCPPSRARPRAHRRRPAHRPQEQRPRDRPSPPARPPTPQQRPAPYRARDRSSSVHRYRSVTYSCPYSSTTRLVSSTTHRYPPPTRQQGRGRSGVLPRTPPGSPRSRRPAHRPRSLPTVPRSDPCPRFAPNAVRSTRNQPPCREQYAPPPANRPPNGYTPRSTIHRY